MPPAATDRKISPNLLHFVLRLAQTLAASRFSPSDFLSRDSIHDVQMHTDNRKLRQTASVCSASESVTIDTTTESLVHPVLTAPPWWLAQESRSILEQASSWNVPTTSTPCSLLKSFTGHQSPPASHGNPVASDETKAPHRDPPPRDRWNRGLASAPQTRIPRRRLHQRAQRHALEQRRPGARTGEHAPLRRPR